jgi:hypothetical protein
MKLYINVTNKREFRKFLNFLEKNGYKRELNLEPGTRFWLKNKEVVLVYGNKNINWYDSGTYPNTPTFPKDKNTILQSLNLLDKYNESNNLVNTFQNKENRYKIIKTVEQENNPVTINYNYIVTDNSIAIFAGAKPFVARKEHPSYQKIKNLVKAQKFEEATKLFDIGNSISNQSNGKITIKNNNIYWNEKPLHNYVASRILALLKEGFDTKPVINFLEDLYNNNPLVKQDNNHYLVNDLFKFLEANDLPWCPDGSFLAWKRVRKDGFDIHSGTIQYKVGEIIEESFDRVDKNRDNHCSVGLHFASAAYYKRSNFGENTDYKTLLVKIMPSWVCSIPSDYGNSKGRAYKMFVYAEYNENTSVNLKSAAVSNYVKSPKRDSMGRFCKSA